MFQKTIIVGNLGNDPELRYMADGTPVCNFSIATNRRWTDSQTGQPVDETTWFRVSVWGRQAETANQYLARGRQVLIEGRLRPDAQTGGPRTYTRQDGTVGASFELTAENVRFIGGRPDEANGAGESVPVAAVESEDIPF
mgnify:CR=1 FL=1